MIDATTLQSWLKSKGLYTGSIDGLVGGHTLDAIVRVTKGHVPPGLTWPQTRWRMAAEQIFLEENGFDVGDVDGLYGPKTEAAHQAWVLKQRETEPNEPPKTAAPNKPLSSGLIKNVWPRQKDVPAFYGAMGAHQVMVDTPYKIYYDGKLVKRMSLHEKCADSARRIMAAVLAEYGQEEIGRLGLNRWSGSLNIRKMRGGNAWSMHSWGIAIDWDAGNNAMYWDHTKATLAKPECTRFWEIWEAEGWFSLGRGRDYDWMHVQAARL